ncbi:MAG: hypothetical protein WC635_14580 [Bacteriovorax sp.]|jgi:hypothetical protein
MLLKLFFTTILIPQLICLSYAEQVPNNLKQYLTYSVDTEINNLYKKSVNHTNELLKTGNKNQLKKNFLKVLNNESDQKYIEEYFSSINKDSLKDLQFSYQNMALFLKSTEGHNIKIKLSGALSTKVNVNGIDFNAAEYTTAKEAIEAFSKIFSTTKADKTVFDTIQSAFLLDNAHAAGIAIVTAAVIAIFYEVFIAANIDGSNVTSCRKNVESALNETSNLLISCNEQLNQISNLDWPVTTAGRILNSSKALSFKINASSVKDITCEKFESNESRLAFRSAMTFFTVKINCMKQESRAQFCDNVERLQVCVEKSKNERVKAGVVDSARNKSKPASSQNSTVPESGKNAPK